MAAARGSAMVNSGRYVRTGASRRTHVGRLLVKLAARDRAQLVIAGYEAGLAPGRGR